MKLDITKLKSRKLWMTILTGALATIGTQLGLDEELVNKLIYLGMTYIGAQAVVDSAAVVGAKETPSK